jgi:hypothetical protein
MATGIEVAGLVLATIPLVLAGLELYANGISATRRYLRYSREFKELVEDLRAEHTIYLNSIQILLFGVVSQNDMTRFLTEPCGDRWKEDKFDQKLRKRLGQTYGSYLETIAKMNDAAEEFKQRLRLDSSGKVCSNMVRSYHVLEPYYHHDMLTQRQVAFWRVERVQGTLQEAKIQPKESGLRRSHDSASSSKFHT